MTENEKRLQAENDKLRTEVAMLRERIAEAMRYLGGTKRHRLVNA